MSASEPTLLICTVGGNHEPIVATIKHWKPERVVFLCTPQSQKSVRDRILPAAESENLRIDEGRFEIHDVEDGQDLLGCLRDLRALADEAHRWHCRGSSHRIVVDITGGTKCMSASLAVVARAWPCVFSYVGGEQRTAHGVGIVVSGQEKVCQQVNPWSALGFQTVEEFVLLFDQRAFEVAAALAESTKKSVEDRDKGGFQALEDLARAHAAWDRFEHKKALHHLKGVEKRVHDLKELLGKQWRDQVVDSLQPTETHLDALASSSHPTRGHVLDLMANAKRRSDEGRFDDAVARLYRATEAVAQIELQTVHDIDNTACVPLNLVPDTLRREWKSRCTGDGTVRVGLQDAYRLLSSLSSDLGESFQKAGLRGRRSPLSFRNDSILAHGFKALKRSTFEELWNKVVHLVGVNEEDLPEMLRFTNQEERGWR